MKLWQIFLWEGPGVSSTGVPAGGNPCPLSQAHSPNPLKLKGGWEGSFREGGGFYRLEACATAPRPSPQETFATVSIYNPEGLADDEVHV